MQSQHDTVQQQQQQQQSPLFTAVDALLKLSLL